MDGWMDGCMDGWMDGWMDGQIDDLREAGREGERERRREGGRVYVKLEEHQQQAFLAAASLEADKKSKTEDATPGCNPLWGVEWFPEEILPNLDRVRVLWPKPR
eukprot:67222-Chlamydomonas_euryale.AAC.2